MSTAINKKRLNKMLSRYFDKMQVSIDNKKVKTYVNLLNSGYLINVQSIQKASLSVLRYLIKDKLLK